MVEIGLIKSFKKVLLFIGLGYYKHLTCAEQTTADQISSTVYYAMITTNIFTNYTTELGKRVNSAKQNTE